MYAQLNFFIVDCSAIRQRGLRHDVFASVPNHPILSDVCSRIISSTDQIYSLLPSFDAMERTGSGVFTDTVLEHTARPDSLASDHDGVRFLPYAVFGGKVGVHCDAPWHANGKSKDGRKLILPKQEEDGNLGEHVLQISEWFSPTKVSNNALQQDAMLHDEYKVEHDLKTNTLALVERIARKEAVYSLSPVTVQLDPPFDILTHAPGVGEWLSGSDVSAALMLFGTWQPSVEPSRGPTLTDVLIGSLGNSSVEQKLFVDVGSGYGLVSLAAAARGHRVKAFEVGSKSSGAFKRSIAWNALDSLIDLEEIPLGSEKQNGEYVCLRTKGVLIDSDDYRRQQRGYGLPLAHTIPPSACMDMRQRLAGARILKHKIDIPAALKISADGWSGFVLEGFLPILKQPKSRPMVVALEWNAALMKSVGYERPQYILERMYELGYQNVSHSGYICDQRWNELTYNIRKRGTTPELMPHLKQPTWCRLHQDEFETFMQFAELTDSVETLLFLDKLQGGVVTSSSPRVEDMAPEGGSGGPLSHTKT